jgi:hypothetical protein
MLRTFEVASLPLWAGRNQAGEVWGWVGPAMITPRRVHLLPVNHGLNFKKMTTAVWRACDIVTLIQVIQLIVARR